MTSPAPCSISCTSHFRYGSDTCFGSSTWASTASSTSSAASSLPSPSSLAKTPSRPGGTTDLSGPPDLFHDGAGELVGIMVGRDPRVDDVDEDGVDAALVDRRRVVDDPLDAGGLGRRRQREVVVAVDHHEVEDVRPQVVLDGLEMGAGGGE